jgi:hypothetical protein
MPDHPSNRAQSRVRVVSDQLPLDVHGDGTGQRYCDLGGDPFGELDSPVHWPSLTGPERDRRMVQLEEWVDQLIARFALDTRVVPPCWPRHHAMVETLSALRDHERASYHQTAPPTAAVDWLRALQDVESLLRSIAGQTQCTTQTHRSEIRRVPRSTDPTDSEQV